MSNTESQSNVSVLLPPSMPVSGADFKMLFGERSKMLTDEIQEIVPKAYDEHQELKDLIGAVIDADAKEGSCRDNFDEAVSIVRRYAKDHQQSFPIAAKAERLKIRRALGVVLRRAGVDINTRRRLACNTALNERLEAAE